MSNYNMYYGEYTLKYWIDMILKHEIKLPPFQRDFVWSEEKVTALITSLKQNSFIPSIIIGTYKENSCNSHYILDGQQRLSAILLAWLGYYPTGKEFNRNGKIFASNNDEILDEDIDSETDGDKKLNVKAWQLTYIQNFNETEKTKIIEEIIKSGKYHKINFKIDNELTDDLLETSSIGFSYIRPNTPNVSEQEQKKYFSTVFRNINISAVDLTPIESRSSLYWLDSDLKNFFQPEDNSVFDKIKINNNELDFARYLALVSEYMKSKRCSTLAKGYSSAFGGKSFEAYIESYIYHTVGEMPTDKFVVFKDVFKNKDYKSQISMLKSIYTNLGFEDKYDSIINLDYTLFGLIYYVLFCNKAIGVDIKEQLNNEINEKIKCVTPEHKRSPAAFKYMRKRIEDSIFIYEKYVK